MKKEIQKSVLLFCFTLCIGTGYGKIPRIRLCGNPECSEIISMCKTTVNYNAGDRDMISFKGNTPCRVMSKSVGEDYDLWEISVQGRRGYAPKSMIMEQKIMIKAANLIQVEDETNKLSSEDDENNIMLPDTPVEEPLARKVDMYKTGAENFIDDDGNPIYSLNDTNEIESSLKPESKEEESSEKLFSTNENTKISDIFNTVLNPDEITISEKQMKSDPTPNIPLQTNNNLREKTEFELTTDIPNLTETNSTEQKTAAEDLNAPTPTDNQHMQFSHNELKGETGIPLDSPSNKSPDQLALMNDDEQINMSAPQEDMSEHIREQVDEPIDTAGEPNTHQQVDMHTSHEDVTEDIGDTLDKSTNPSNVFASLTDDQKISMQALREDVPEEIQESVTESTDHSKEQQSAIAYAQKIARENVAEEIQDLVDESTDHSKGQYASNTVDPEMSMHVSLEDVTKDIRESVEESTDRLDEFYSAITDDQKMSMKASREDVTEEIQESVTESTDHSKEQHASITDQQEEAVKPLESVHAENIFSDNSKEHYPDIFSPHQETEESWSDTISGSLHDVSLFTQSLYTSFFSGNNEPMDQCEYRDGEDYNNEFCSKNRLNEKPTTAFFHNFNTDLISNGDLKTLLLLEVVAILLFIFGHYFLVNRRMENVLVSKLNATERRLFTSEKECSIAKSEVFEKRKVLDGIADKSFGTDDMIRQLEGEKAELREQIYALEKELEAAAEAGLELNKMVAELLSSNQNGSESIINSVEELQQQLNEQEATSIYINNLLAEKSRENSELRVQLSETSQTFGGRIDELMHANKLLCEEKEATEVELNDVKQAYKLDLDGKSSEISQLREDYVSLEKKYDEVLTKWQSSAAQVEALKKALSQIENASIDEIKSIQDFADANAKYLAAEKGNELMKECLSSETELRKRLQSQIKDLTIEISQLRSTANQNEKEKIEAQNRLDVLSSYFKEKEIQLQSELDIKEALVIKQKGESTTTQLQDEIQGLRAQNEQLRAEIEAQSVAHKAQINTIEMRAHDSWLAAKQAERRLEEAKSEASVLRKKLTSLSGAGNTNTDGHTNDFNVPSPPSPLMNLPPPPLVPFLPPPPLPLNDIRPAPLGRLMSPPPDRFRYDELNDTDFSPPRSPPGYAYKSKGSSSGSEWDRQTF